jgi:hypothetical protein
VQATEILSSDDIHLLTEVGMVGAGARLHVDALALFEALAVLRSWRDFPWVGQVTVWLNRGDADAAVRVLEKGCQCAAQPPEGVQTIGGDLTLLTAFLGFAQHMARRTADSHQTMQKVLRMPFHAHAHAMAKDMLGLVHQNTRMNTYQEPSQ